MTLILALSLATSLGDLPAEIDGPQFLRLMQGAHARFQDVSFIFEGDSRFVGPAELDPQDMSDRTDCSFQGAFAYRADGAILLDVYTRPFNPTVTMVRDIVAYAGDREERLQWFADTKPPEPRVRKGVRQSYEGLDRSKYPLQIFYSILFNTLTSMEGLNYKFRGWEAVDGRRCLCVQFDRIPGLTTPDRPSRRLWIDLERGGHPLKVEFYGGEQLTGRLAIELGQVPTPDGQLVWFPRKGVRESFLWGERSMRNPIFRETCLIVPSTVRFDRALPDSVFSVAGADTLQDSHTLDTTRTDFENTPPRPPEPRPRTDRASVQAHLDEMLAKADSQANQLEASSPARGAWGPLPRSSWILGGLGVALIGGALLWKLRSP